MQITHGIHHENIDVGWQQEHVLRERGEHVPGFKMHERADKIETIGGKDSNKYFLERSIVLNQAERNP